VVTIACVGLYVKQRFFFERNAESLRTTTICGAYAMSRQEFEIALAICDVPQIAGVAFGHIQKVHLD